MITLLEQRSQFVKISKLKLDKFYDLKNSDYFLHFYYNTHSVYRHYSSQTQEPSDNFEKNLLYNPREYIVVIVLNMTGCWY